MRDRSIPPTSHNLCVKCGNNTVATTDSRVNGQWRTRRKRCTTCHHRWTTVEVPAMLLRNVEIIMQSLHNMSARVDELQEALEQTRRLALIEEGKPFSIISRQLYNSLGDEDTHGSA